LLHIVTFGWCIVHRNTPRPVSIGLVLLQRNGPPACRTGATVAKKLHTNQAGGGKIQGPAKIR